VISSRTSWTWRCSPRTRTTKSSAYADRRVMPTVVVNVQVGGVAGVGWSA
jgi:hypothetical protein